MTFNIQIKLNNKKEVFLSGGRFDSLIKDLGNKKELNAVGAAHLIFMTKETITILNLSKGRHEKLNLKKFLKKIN